MSLPAPYYDDGNGVTHWYDAIREQAAPNTCALCRYWDSSAEQFPWGECLFALAHHGDTNAYADGDGMLVTKDSFGCTNYQPDRIGDNAP